MKWSGGGKIHPPNSLACSGAGQVVLYSASILRRPSSLSHLWVPLAAHGALRPVQLQTYRLIPVIHVHVNPRELTGQQHAVVGNEVPKVFSSSSIRCFSQCCDGTMSLKCSHLSMMMTASCPKSTNPRMSDFSPSSHEPSARSPSLTRRTSSRSWEVCRPNQRLPSPPALRG